MKSCGKSYSYKIIGNCNGGIPSRVTFVLITLIIIGSVLFVLLDNDRKISKYNHEKAIIISEYGFQEMMEQVGKYLRDDPSKIKDIEKTEYDEGWYKVDVSTSLDDSILTLIVKSEGNCGNQSLVKKDSIFLIRSFRDDDSVWMRKQNR